ncbi:MAG: type II secretion system secretin GspD [Candidatus Competibacteraceae bacterium]|nr:type II secretion system secretin GspD [Candidatus Competibacteraceae bacterium]
MSKFEEHGTLTRIIAKSFATGMSLILGLSACAVTPDEAIPPGPDGDSATAAAPATTSAGDTLRLIAQPGLPQPANMGALDPSAPRARPRGVIFPGSGNFVDLREASQPTDSAKAVAPAPGNGVTLNFEDVSIRDVVKVVFDTLKENYVIDPQVQGAVTVQTSRPLTPGQLLPILEILLRENNAVLVREDGVYRIVPATVALQQGNLKPRLGVNRVGYGVRIVPLRYVSAIEMQTIIKPFLPEGGILQADATRNLLILAGTPQELNSVQETIDTFDVNWLRGMTIGMFRLRNIDSTALANELNQLLGKDSGTPIAGLVRLVPLSKLNSILAISPQREYLREVAAWIERLDGVGGERLYVYPIENSRADYVAELLNGLFNLGGGSGATRGGAVAPGLKGSSLSSSGGLTGSSTSSSAGSSTSSSLGGGASSSSLSASSKPGGGSDSGIGAVLGSGGPSAGMEEVRIVADSDNNSLLIWATSQNYERIVSTLQKIDVPPRQVLIEATIAEVTLTGRLQYGLQWYFDNGVGKDGYTGTGSLGLPVDLTLSGDDGVLASVQAGQFSYAVTDGGGIVRALLTALASDSKVKVLSSPQVMVVDNQQATIRVGTDQPIPTGTSTVNNVTTTGGVTYKETGVLLEVLPRVNSGGMVSMEIKQEVVDVGPLTDVSQAGSVARQERSFLQRTVTSKVTVKSGQTLVLGGLIRDNRTDGQSGIPGLYKIPVLGALFGTTSEQVDRTELIVLITPRVVQTTQEIDQVTEEIKRKMRAVEPVLNNAG